MTVAYLWFMHTWPKWPPHPYHCWLSSSLWNGSEWYTHTHMKSELGLGSGLKCETHITKFEMDEGDLFLLKLAASSPWAKRPSHLPRPPHIYCYPRHASNPVAYSLILLLMLGFLKTRRVLPRSLSGDQKHALIICHPLLTSKSRWRNGTMQAFSLRIWSHNKRIQEPRIFSRPKQLEKW